jgi:hypothetical protein
METEKFIRQHEALQKSQQGASFLRTSTSSTSQPTESTPDTPLDPNSNLSPNLNSSQNPTSGGDEARPTFPVVLPTIRHDIKALSPYDLIRMCPSLFSPFSYSYTLSYSSPLVYFYSYPALSFSYSFYIVPILILIPWSPSLSLTIAFSFLSPLLTLTLEDSPSFVPPSGCEGLTILLGIVCSCMRATRLPSSKIIALDLLRRFALYLQDECRLQRIVPYPLLGESSEGWRGKGITTFTVL